jgi:hypothetical protein
VCQGQKAHLFRPSLSFLVEAQPRLENRRGQKAFFSKGAQLQSKRHHWKNYKFILYLPTNSFSVFFYQFATKTRNLLFAIQLLIYIIYDDRTIIGFVGLLVKRPKKSYFSVACEYVKLHSFH